MSTLSAPMLRALDAIERNDYDGQRTAPNTRRALARLGLIELRGDGRFVYVLTERGRAAIRARGVPVKAITVRQPFAELILRGTKSIENRSFQTGYRGALIIHSGVRWEPGGQHMPRGVLGVVDLLDMHPVEECTGSPCERRGALFEGPWRAWHWELRNPRRVEPPREAHGRMGLWVPAPELVEHVRGVL